MVFSRASGILLHPTSLPSRFGIGDLGFEAYRFVDFLEASDQKIWQILPLGPVGYGNSPYMCYSAIAGNPLLLDLDALCSQDLVTLEEIAYPPSFPFDRVDYELVNSYKLPLLRKAYERFQVSASDEQKQEFKAFCDRSATWLDDYSLFTALKQHFGDLGWYGWPEAIAKRDPNTLKAWREKLIDDVEFCRYLQYEFNRQWAALKQYANARGIEIFGDIPIYVAHDSADVWAHSEIFCLDPNTGQPTEMSGVPPDYFSETGQLWGNPVYNWDVLAKDGFKWWIQRFKSILEYVDLIRIDHFRGFESYWSVPGGEETAMNGKWVEAPGREFFIKLRAELGELPIVAEDLGIITPEVEALRDEFDFPGMKILHFAFDSGAANPYLPYNYATPNCVVYTGTHDNNTTMGWYEARSADENQWLWNYLGCSRGEGVNWDLIRLALASVANLAIFPMQDLLGLGTGSRMNEPSKATGNWDWQLRPNVLNEDLSGRMRFYTGVYGRTPQRPAPPEEIE
ncbi:MAG: 4-alpha-glucanotransferase [Geitlerinemataceae cyanobacterium]